MKNQEQGLNLSPELLKRLQKVLNRVAAKKDTNADVKQKQRLLLGLGAIALAVPAVAVGGLTPAFQLLKFAAPKLHQAWKHDHKGPKLKATPPFKNRAFPKPRPR